MPLTNITGEQTTSDGADAFLYYHARSHVTGNRLGEFLGIPHGRNTSEPVDYLIRWGQRSGAGFRPNQGVINSQSALNNNADKMAALRQLDEAGVQVPNYTQSRDDFGDTIDYPILGREESHARGEDINLILQWRDAYLTDNDFFVEYIPTELEYRMHVVDGEVIKIHEKRKQSDAPNHPFIRNSETGYIFMEPRETPPPDQLAIDAVGALSLDFGAVDVIREEGTGDHYVLEVNSAPSLDEANMERYGSAIADMIGLEHYPGLDAVSFDGENEEDEEQDDSSNDLGELFG